LAARGERVWADTDTDVDYLNYSEVAELVAEMVGNERMLPLSLGVFGTWGTGKSSILRLVQADLAKDKDKYIFVEFDAWLYQDFDDARAALMPSSLRSCSMQRQRVCKKRRKASTGA
jgi:predicted KAP-like P-loop ATPase